MDLAAVTKETQNVKDSGNSLHVTGSSSQVGRTEGMKMTAASSEISVVGFAQAPSEAAIPGA